MVGVVETQVLLLKFVTQADESCYSEALPSSKHESHHLYRCSPNSFLPFMLPLQVKEARNHHFNYVSVEFVSNPLQYSSWGC